MEQLEYIDRRHTNCDKWDGLEETFGQGDLLPLWVADMDYRSPRCVREALQAYVEMGAFGYLKTPDSYYEAIVDWEREHHGLELQRDWLRYSPGVVAGINWILCFLTEPGDAVIVNTPVYYPFLHAIEDNGRTLVTSPLVNTDGVYTIDYADFERQIVERRVKLFILCSPHNPVGRVWRREELEQLFAICARHGVYILSDEIHHDLIRDGYTHTPSLALEAYRERTIALIAPSKTFNLAACQHAIAILPDAALRERWDVAARRIHLTSGAAFGYVACEAAYRGGEAWYRQICARIYANMDILQSRLAALAPRAVVTPLEGTYLAWIDLRAYTGTEPGAVHDFMQKRCGIAPDYGEWFGGEAYAGFIRLNLATAQENIEQAARAIGENISDR